MGMKPVLTVAPREFRVDRVVSMEPGRSGTLEVKLQDPEGKEVTLIFSAASKEELASTLFLLAPTSEDQSANTPHRAIEAHSVRAARTPSGVPVLALSLTSSIALPLVYDEKVRAAVAVLEEELQPRSGLAN